MSESNVLFEHTIHATAENLWKFTITSFRGEEYINIRKYFLSFEEEWVPLKEGVTIELTVDNARELFRALVKILALAEIEDIALSEFKELLNEEISRKSS